MVLNQEELGCGHGIVRTEILHELPPPMLIDIALVVAAAADDAVPVAAMSIVVEVPMSMFAKDVF